MKKIILIVLVLLAAKISFSQSDSSKRVYDVEKWKVHYFPNDDQLKDSLIIFGYHYKIVVAAQNMKLLMDERMQMNVMINDFQSAALGKLEKMPDYPRSRITYNVIYGSLFIEELDTTNKAFYNFKENDFRRWPYRNECLIRAPWLNLTIYYYEDSVLMNPDLQTVLNEVLALKTSKQWANSGRVYATCLSESKKIQSVLPEDRVTKITYTHKDDSKINVHVACGIGTTRTFPVLSAEIKAGYEWYDYGYKIAYYLSYDWNFSFAENGDRNINGFLNLSALEDEFVPRVKTMAGVDMGYLIFRQGDVFEKNTFRIGLGFKGDFFYVSPQLYFPGSFKGVYPGLRLNIGL